MFSFFLIGVFSGNYCYADTDPQSICYENETILSNLEDIYQFLYNEIVEFRLFNSNSTKFTLYLDRLGTHFFGITGNPWIEIPESNLITSGNLLMTNADITFMSTNEISILGIDSLTILNLTIHQINTKVRLQVVNQLQTTFTDISDFQRVDTHSVIIFKPNITYPAEKSVNLYLRKFPEHNNRPSRIIFDDQSCQLSVYQTEIRLNYASANFLVHLLFINSKEIELNIEEPKSSIQFYWMSEYSSIAGIFITLGGDSLITVIHSIALDTSNAVLVDVTHGSLVFGTSVTYVPFKILTNINTMLNIMYSSQVFFYGFQFDGGVVRIETVIDHPPILCREIIVINPPDLSCNEYQPIRVSNLQFRNSMNFEPKNLDLIAEDMITLEDSLVTSSAIRLQRYVHYYFKPSLTKPTGLYTNSSLVNNSLIELYYRNVLPDEEIIQKNKNKRFWIQCSPNLSCYNMHYKLNIQTQMKFNFNYVCEKISEEDSCFGIYYKNSPREIDIDICYDAYGNYDICKDHDFFFSHDNFSQWVNLLTRETETINFSISSSLTIALDFEQLKSEVDVTINSIANRTIDITLLHTKTLGTYIKCLNLSNVNLNIDPLDKTKEFSIKKLSLLQESKLTEKTYNYFNFSDVKLTIDMSELKDRHIDSFETINCIIYHNFVIVRLTNSTVSFNTHSCDTSRLKNINFILSAETLNIQIKEDIDSLQGDLHFVSEKPYCTVRVDTNYNFDNYKINKNIEFLNFQTIYLKTNISYLPFKFTKTSKVHIGSSSRNIFFPDQEFDLSFFEVQVSSQTSIYFGSFYVHKHISFNFLYDNLDMRPTINSLILDGNISVILKSAVVTGIIKIPATSTLLTDDVDFSNAVFRIEVIPSVSAGSTIHKITIYKPTFPLLVEVFITDTELVDPDNLQNLSIVKAGTPENCEVWMRKLTLVNDKFASGKERIISTPTIVNSSIHLKFDKIYEKRLMTVSIVVITFLSVFIIALIISIAVLLFRRKKVVKSSIQFQTISD